MPSGKSRAKAAFWLAFFALTVSPRAISAPSMKSAAGAGLLREKAWTAGRAQVIVHFSVPEIERLTAASAQFGSFDETPERAFERSLADAALAKTIEYASWKITAELQGTEYEVVSRFDYIPFLTLRVSPNALAVLENSPDVLGIEEDRVQKLIDPPEGEEKDWTGERPISDDPRVFPMLDDSASLIGASAAGIGDSPEPDGTWPSSTRASAEPMRCSREKPSSRPAGRWARTAPAAAPTAKPS